MPSLAELTDYTSPKEEAITIRPVVETPTNLAADADTSVGTVAKRIADRLLGLNGQERYQLWPEKVVREALSAPHDVMTGETPQYQVDPVTGDVHTSLPMIEKAQSISALAGTGGLAGTGEGGAVLGAGPIYKTAKSGYDLLKNPSLREIEGLISKEGAQGVRMMIDPNTNDVYAFNNLKYTHDEVAKELLHENIELPYSMGTDKVSVNDYHIIPLKDNTYAIGGGSVDRLPVDNPNLKRIFRDKNIRIANGDAFEDALVHSKYNGQDYGHDTDISNLFKINPIKLYSDSSKPAATIQANRASLRPALKYKDKLYKGKPGQEHQDVIPPHLYPEFQDMAMKGEDISHYNFGFVNDKGHFLNREEALKYGIDTGIIDPQAGKFGALTSTLYSTGNPGIPIEATYNDKKFKLTPVAGNPFEEQR